MGNLIKFQNYNNRLHDILNYSIQKNDIELSLETISAISSLYYVSQECYCDDEIEEILSGISDKIVGTIDYFPVKNRVLFYDGFGEDLRGLAIIYLKALIQNNFEVVYITKKSSENNQPILDTVITDSGTVKLYYDATDNYSSRTKWLKDQVLLLKPEYCFMYTQPWDVSGSCVFNKIPSNRFQIDLTDHAFWIGKNAFDKCIEFREYGYYLASKRRNIDKTKLLILPYYPYYDTSQTFQGFNFEYENKKIIFSGGAINKTFSKDNYYYRLIDQILMDHEDCIFLYAGSGDFSRFDTLKRKYNERIQLISERKDLVEVLRHSHLYLNTYPIMGGLMTQYAVLAGRVPLALIPKGKKPGLLENEENLRLYFDNYSELITEINHLLNDDTYRLKKEQSLKNAVTSPEVFANKLKEIISGSSLEVNCKGDFNYSKCSEISNEDLRNAIAKTNHKKLIVYFPKLFVERKLTSLLKRR